MITHDRWRRIKEIFQSAQVIKTPTERLDFLNQTCGDDKLLREEVEALLRADESNEDFLKTPALEFAKGMLADEAKEINEFAEGQKVGRYIILCPLGAGGMGQIYLAQDEQLGRKIALKFIAREFATDPRRVLRFEQEARAVSSLNHPNVCVIHETGVTENNRHFIAMEYIQGETLRDKLTRETLTPLEAVQIAIQVSEALASAHAAGIVHRDIKPENIMLRPDGYVKVLDFGLAKLAERVPQGGTRGASPTVNTEAGTLMGTVKYMSPEQLREAELDERTDIWSLGVVLYEMLTRTTPFEAHTPNDTIALILGPQTPPLTFSDELPAHFHDIVGKAIEKDRTSRYQTVNKLAADLDTLKKELAHLAVNGLVSRDRPFSRFSTPTDGQKTRQTLASAPIFTRLKSQALSTADFLFSEIRTHKTAAAFTGATGVLVLLLLIPGAARLINNLVSKDDQPPRYNVTPLTNAARSLLAAVSLDGKRVAHIEDVQGRQRVVIGDLNTPGTDVVIPAEDDVRYLGLTFSHDNSYLYVTRKEKHGPGILYRVTQMGGTPARLKDGVDSPISLSPNGDQFAFVRFDETKSEYYVMTAGIDGSNERTLATRKDGANFSTYGLSWSPDGTMIVCPAGRWERGFHIDLVAIDAKTGVEQLLGEKDWFSVYQVGWEPDMKALIISARERGAAKHQIWRITFPNLVVQKVTRDANEYFGVSVSRENIVTTRTERSWRIQVATAGTLAPSTQISTGFGFTYGLTWINDKSFVHSAMAGERMNIFRVDPDGLNQVQLTNEGDNYNPVASSDGRFVVFSSNIGDGRFNIWRMNPNGGDLKPLTFTDANYYPSISPDNKWVAYDNMSGTKLTVWKVRIDGGEPIKVVDGYRMPVFSPDGRYLAVRYDLESGSRDIAIFPADGGEAVKRIVFVPILEWQRVQWLDKHTLSYIKSVNGISNLWSYDIDTDATKQLTFFDSDQIAAYTWSQDCKRVACQRVTNIGDVTKISSER